MTLPDHQNTFDLLIAGILAAARSNWQVPYPAVFSQAINQLSCLLAFRHAPIPMPLQDWMSLFELPISEWWPEDPSVLGIQTTEQLALMLSGQPDDWLTEYFETREIDIASISKSLTSFKSEIDQQEINTLRQWCRLNNQPDLYSQFREFLIARPYATLWELSDFMLGWFGLRMPILIQALYEEPGPERIHQGQFWVCPYCHGILKWRAGKPSCIRSSVCGRLTNQYQEMRPIPIDSNLRVLKYGVHERTCVPGIPELALRAQCLPDQIAGVKDVVLWPGFDAYDLRVTFVDNQSWAIDVKDLREAYGLRRTIDRALGGLYSVREDTGLEWEQAFYVVPDFRTEWTPGYLDIARSDHLLAGESEVLATSEMIARVQHRAAIAIQHVGGEHV
ncbi:MAG: hypothetical protein PHQ40_05580 [Anaerolineaceae bacterium]|nr:hypothetical protein [Anaerolineaceae bacterium]